MSALGVIIFACIVFVVLTAIALASKQPEEGAHPAGPPGPSGPLGPRGEAPANGVAQAAAGDAGRRTDRQRRPRGAGHAHRHSTGRHGHPGLPGGHRAGGRHGGHSGGFPGGDGGGFSGGHH
jgi:hypothetical protein